MSRDKNFLLGQGERLTSPVKVPKKPGEKNPPYSFSKAKERLEKKLTVVSKELDSIPKEACPKDQVVALVTMHPRYISKSDFPEDLFRSVYFLFDHTCDTLNHSAHALCWSFDNNCDNNQFHIRSF